VEDRSLEKTLRRDLDVDPDFPIFVPATTYTKKGRSITLHLMQGYLFISSGLPETAYFKLERKSYVNRVMSSTDRQGMRVLRVLPNDEIAKIRKQLRELVSSDISIGEEVRVVDGVYATLEGDVIDVEGDMAVVRFEFRSLNLLTSIPLVFLESIS